MVLSCPLDNHSKICQLSVLSTWLITWMLLSHANPPVVMRDFWSTNTHSFQSRNSAPPSDSGIYCPRGKDLDLDGNASWMFWIPISFKIQVGVFLGFVTLEKNTYGSILMIGHRRFAVVQQTVDFIHALFPLTACTVSHLWYAWLHHLLQRNQSPNKKYSSLTILVMLITA